MKRWWLVGIVVGLACSAGLWAAGKEHELNLEEKVKQILDNEQKILQRLEEVFQEAQTVKIRATMR